MNKELGRKITSLTLMTIMLTWSAAMGFSGSFMPEAEAANQYLWVSVEDSGNNNFYGGQVLEIVVTDPAINRLDEAYGMPDVTIDGKKVIMAQGVAVLGMHILLMARKQPQSTTNTQKLKTVKVQIMVDGVVQIPTWNMVQKAPQ